MSNQTLQFINKSIKKKDKYNIITFDTHERYQTQLAKTGHNFYIFRHDGGKEWDKSYGDMPDNHYVMPQNSIQAGIDYDFIISQSKFGQFGISQNINSIFKLPLVSLEHTLPIPSWPNEQLEAFKKQQGDINVFISDYSVNKWNMDAVSTRVIHHSVDTDLFHPNQSDEQKKQPHVLSVVNDWINRDYCCNWQGYVRITDEGRAFQTKIVGKTEGLSEPAPSVKELAKEYATSQVFLNTSTISPVPTALLEAMSCGCAIVTTATCMIPEIIEHGVNGFMSNDEEELRGYCKQLLEDEELRNKMGAEARGTILTNFSEQKFINNWNEVFDVAYGVIK